MTLLSTTSNATPVARGAKAASKHSGVITEGATVAIGVKAAQGVAKHPGIITKGAKGALGVMGVEAAAKHPRVVRVGVKTGKPVARRKVRKGIGQVELIGASAVYFFERGCGRSIDPNCPTWRHERRTIKI